VDTPTREELIGANHPVEEIRQFLGADSLGYLSYENMRRAVDDRDGTFCTSCYTGIYPTEFVQLEVAHQESSHRGIPREGVSPVEEKRES
jgi:amidophosphoribosyltransferase